LITGSIAIANGQFSGIRQVVLVHPHVILVNTWFLGPTWVLNQNGILIGSSVFAGLTNVTDRQTDQQTTLLGLKHMATSTYLVLRCGLKIKCNVLVTKKSKEVKTKVLKEKPGIEWVQALADISCSVLRCHSNRTRAAIANPPNSAQLEGTPYHSPTYSRVRAVVWQCSEGQADRHTDGRDQCTFCLGYASCEM